MLYSPFEQFRIFDLFLFDTQFVFSNALLILFFSFVSYFAFFLLLISPQRTPINFNFFTFYFSYLYSFLFDLVKTYMGRRLVNRYFPFFFFLFLIIFLCNLIGLLPYSFTLTSHLFFNISLSLIVWLGVFLLGLHYKGKHYFNLFIPKGVAPILLSLLVVIEFVSCLFRIFSLAIRLLANMVAGHLLLDCLIFYVYNIIYSSFYFFSFSFNSLIKLVLPLALILLLLMFESFVCFLQAYIFIILSLLYLKEIL